MSFSFETRNAKVKIYLPSFLCFRVRVIAVIGQCNLLKPTLCFVVTYAWKP